MGKIQMSKEEKNNQRVIITTYVESKRSHSHPKRDRIKRINPRPFSNKPPTARTHGYDRKAQLLAYAKELRKSNSQHLNCPTTHSSSKFTEKRSWIPFPAKLRHSLGRFFDRTSREPCKYERIKSEGKDGSFMRSFQFCRRVKKLMKVWSSACNCKRSVF